MRQILKSFNNVSAHITNDLWPEAKGVTLSEKLTGTTRFQISRAKLLEGFKLVNGRPTKIQKVTRPDSVWPEAWTKFPRNKKTTLQNVWKKVLKYEVLTDVKDFFKGSAGARVKLETDTALVLRCIEKDGSRGQPQAVATSVDASEEQSTSEHTEHARENETTTYGPHRRNGTCGMLSRSFGKQASFCSRSHEDARSHGRNGKIMNKNLDIANMGCEESATKVRSCPSHEGRWKKHFIFATLMDSCHLKNAELAKHLQKYKGASCALV